MSSGSPRPDTTLADVLAAVERAGARGEPLTTTEVAAELDCSRRTAYDKLGRLAERGDVETKKAGARSRVWWRPVAGPRSGAGGDRLERLATAVTAVTEAETAEDAAAAAVDALATAVDVEAAVLYLFDPGADALAPTAVAGERDQSPARVARESPVWACFVEEEVRTVGADGPGVLSGAGGSERTERAIPLGDCGVLVTPDAARPLVDLVAAATAVTLERSRFRDILDDRDETHRDDHFRAEVAERLTDRQREVLETAYRSGYFVSPREATGADLADALGVSQPTVTEHIRTAEAKIVELLFEEGPGSP